MKVYICRPGDSISSLSRGFGIEAEELIKLNSLCPGRKLSPGLPLLLDEFREKRRDMDLALSLPPVFPESCLSPFLPALSYCCCGRLGIREDGSLIYPEEGPELCEMLRARSVLPLAALSNFESGAYSGSLLHSVLKSGESHCRLRDNILRLAEDYKYAGIQLEFFYLPEFAKPALCDFLSLLHESFLQAGLYLFTCISDSPESPEYYRLLNDSCHRIILPAYDFSHILSPPGPVCHMEKLEKLLKELCLYISPQKLLLGLSDYGLDFTLPWSPGNRAQTLSRERARKLALSGAGEISFNGLSGASSFSYCDFCGNKHLVYYEDLPALGQKLELLYNYNLSGLYIMRPAPCSGGLLPILSGEFGFNKYI